MSERAIIATVHGGLMAWGAVLLLESGEEPYRVLSWRNASDGSTAPQKAPSR